MLIELNNEELSWPFLFQFNDDSSSINKKRQVKKVQFSCVRRIIQRMPARAYTAGPQCLFSEDGNELSNYR